MGEVRDARHPGAHRAALPLFVAAELLGGYRWVEQQLFALCGRWAARTDVRVLQVHLDEASAQHAWHAELWFDRLPVLDGVDREALTRPPDAAVDEVMGTLAAADGAAAGTGARDGLLAAVAGLHRVVLPRLVASYERHLAAAAPVADAPTMRTLRLVLDDERAELATGEHLLGALAAHGGAADAAGTFAHALAERLDRVEIRPGLVIWPESDPPGRAT